jgi:hypothetical protein
MNVREETTQAARSVVSVIVEDGNEHKIDPRVEG